MLLMGLAIHLHTNVKIKSTWFPAKEKWSEIESLYEY